ncbi:MAG: hypothetical protein KAU36_02205 [candidate division Zixibacteria bacterium]|nr:hypothetical protein [candidate division Zixibacteria bacterium]
MIARSEFLTITGDLAAMAVKASRLTSNKERISSEENLLIIHRSFRGLKSSQLSPQFKKNMRAISLQKADRTPDAPLDKKALAIMKVTLL